MQVCRLASVEAKTRNLRVYAAWDGDLQVVQVWFRYLETLKEEYIWKE